LRVRKIDSRRRGDPRFPYVLTTYRLLNITPLAACRVFLSHLSELQPEMFAEISPELARELKIKNADYNLHRQSARGD